MAQLLGSPLQVRWLRTFVDFFTFEQRLKEARLTPEALRKAVRAHIGLSRQRAEAAERLLDAGHPAEAFRMALSALEEAIQATQSIEEGIASPGNPSRAPAPKENSLEPWQKALIAKGINQAKVQAIGILLEDLAEHPPPSFDRDITPQELERLHRVLHARALIDSAIYPVTIAPDGWIRRKKRRLLWFLTLLFGTALLAWWLTHEPEGVFVSASSKFGAGKEWGPEWAVDGNPKTEWLLPDHRSGWIELRIHPPRRIKRVLITNACNEPHFDRATRDYLLEVWSNQKIAKRIEGWMPFSTDRKPIEHEIKVDAVERLRFIVRSWHRLGGGVAEIHFE
ncbi:MAG: hypothetical protein RMJ84_11530 [Sandaracinaceae bacterium]|nr:hypothetical protein [Sandaracinaceae bacterium]